MELDIELLSAVMSRHLQDFQLPGIFFFHLISEDARRPALGEDQENDRLQSGSFAALDVELLSSSNVLAGTYTSKTLRCRQEMEIESSQTAETDSTDFVKPHRSSM